MSVNGYSGNAIMDGDIVNCSPMSVNTTANYSRILEQGLYITQLDGCMSYALLQAVFGHFFRWVRSVCLLSDTQALIDFMPPEKGKLPPVYFNIFTRMVRANTDGSVIFPPRFVSCMPILEAPSENVHDYVMMYNEYTAPNGTVLLCDVIRNPDFQSA